VSDSLQPAPQQDQLASTGEGEEVDALPVLASEPQAPTAHSSPGALPGEWRIGGVVIPAVQAAAVAAGGFVAGAAIVGLVHRRQRRSAGLSRGRRIGRDPSRRGRGRGGRAGELIQIVGSRSFLVDVHLLGGADGSR